MGSALDAAFWDRFVSEHYEKQPGVFRGVVEEPLCTPDDLMTGLRAVAQKLTSGVNMDSTLEQGMARLYIDGRRLGPTEFLKFIPDVATLDDYFGSVSNRLAEGEQFGVVLTGFHNLATALWPRVRRFCEPLVARVGIPAAEIESAVFFGDYGLTPFGIHKDIGNAVFTFTVIGRKRFLLWPPGYFDAQPLALYLQPDPAAYMKDALILEVGPGDMLYWPSNWYHTAYSEEREPNASFSVGFWHELRLADTLKDIVGEMVTRSLGEHATVVGSWDASDRLPAPLERAIEAVEAEVRAGQLAARVRAHWQARVAQGGFVHAPPREPERE